MLLVAISLTAARLARSPVKIVALAAATRLLWLVCGLANGTLAGRFQERRSVIFAEGGWAAVLGLLVIAVATGHAVLSAV
ncbi:MAG TPA: hypothetical protein VND70_09035 [Acidimicrobiales bacterium]|nr:hypothetical protein [Acidimicrobiales bacterium]